MAYNNTLCQVKSMSSLLMCFILFPTAMLNSDLVKQYLNKVSYYRENEMQILTGGKKTTGEGRGYCAC